MTTPNPSTPATDPGTHFGAYVSRIDEVLDEVLPPVEARPERLHEAMRYVVTAGGKRVRPLLAYGAAEALAVPLESADSIAASLELIHAYSLVHDDLPAMDDDELRRGKPTCHIAFDEATAILAGDALQALAFEVLVRPCGAVTADRAGALVGELVAACGSQGMAGGQAIDLQAVGRDMTLEALEEMHALKTGALIRAAVRLPAVGVGASARQVAALSTYGNCVGLAFQIQDDILDIEGSTEELGKPQGSDVARSKPTFPALLGIDESRRRTAELLDRSLAALEALPGDATLLVALARYTVERRK